MILEGFFYLFLSLGMVRYGKNGVRNMIGGFVATIN